MGLGSSTACSLSLNTSFTPEQQARYQNEEVIRELLDTVRTVALVGLSADTQKASYFVAAYLQYAGYQIIPVTPRKGEILGSPTYSDLRSVPVKINLVDIFRPAGEVAGIVDQAIAVGAKAVWTQLRIADFAAAEKALAAGLRVVMDKCVKMEHGRYQGGLHLAGMNTEIVTARRTKRFRDVSRV